MRFDSIRSVFFSEVKGGGGGCVAAGGVDALLHQTPKEVLVALNGSKCMNDILWTDSQKNGNDAHTQAHTATFSRRRCFRTHIT